MSLANRVKAALTSAGMSQSELARRLRVEPSAINHILTGRTRAIKAQTLVDIAHHLNVSAIWLETGKGASTPDARMTPDEAECLGLYRRLNDNGRASWLSVGRTLYDAQPSMGPSTMNPFKKPKTKA
jgi:transcriptional regulator with XRE-family HTH domain